MAKILGAGSRLLGTFLAGLIPAFSLAMGGEAVDLEFSSSDLGYLYVSLAIGAISLITGFLIARWVLAQDMGTDAMQNVGRRIREGALAYLRQQVQIMAIFVAIIAAALFFMYRGQYDTSVAIYVALAFVGGVAASYIAGYVGMIMAVSANVRTAAAAFGNKFAKTLEVAFRAGAVAGLMTVGMGLVGATLIFLLAKGDAMKVLIGFGFGGSLAALFMRVGGGIFTKAADVGADLVGKVEAGIPEDDPRNPATIADNVGDNVGDCAGMAADVFESYEVTLVAAIVLGAATAVIFDQETWMKLILFAIMARGVGIIASIVGVFMVKGSDDIDKDPLKLISFGFKGSAVVAAVLTLGLAWFMLGRGGTTIAFNEYTTPEQYQNQQLILLLEKLEEVRADVAETQGIEPFEVTTEDIAEDRDVADFLEAFNVQEAQYGTVIEQLATLDPDDPDQLPEIEEIEQLTQLTEENEAELLEGLSIQNLEAPGYIPLAEAVEIGEYIVAHVEITTETTPLPPLNADEDAPAPEPVVSTQDFYYGPVTSEQLENERTMREQLPGTTFAVLDEVPVGLYLDEEDNLYAVAGEDAGVDLLTFQSALGLSYFVGTPEEVEKRITSGAFPEQKNATFAEREETPVEWWRFFACVFFGIIMAWVFERLTDYYVSFRRKPVEEVANVASAGPAPMIIQGFASGLESSVMSVLAIVACLIAPLILFPPEQFGGYLLSFYGIALVGLGLLTTTGFILAMDTFGPISDNAQGIFEMSGAGRENRTASTMVQRLDAAGNTTKALTKGFAIATAVVAAVALFHSYVEAGMLTEIGMSIDLPEIFFGLLLGAAAPYLFSAFSINAVGRAAFDLINEVRRQFKADPGIMAGTSEPDSARCVAIVTRAAQTELLGPGVLAIFFPIAVAFGFSIGKEATIINDVAYNLTGAQALGGFLAGAIVSGQLMAVLLANSGGIWDNAKKLIEDGLHGGKGTDAHKAGIVCDTVGDPFKDTAGPALNPLIKVMNLVALLLAPVVIVPYSKGVTITVTVVSVALLVFSFWWSKRGSLSTSMTALADTAPPTLEEPAVTQESIHDTEIIEPEKAPDDDGNGRS